MNKFDINSGFSLIELLIVMAIVAIFASGAVIWLIGYQRQAELDSAAKNIINTLRDAQARSTSGKDFKPWGVYFDAAGNKYVLFRNEGGGYGGTGGQVVTAKEENYLSSFVKIGAITLTGGGNEIIFNKSLGDTGQYGSANGNNTAVRIEQNGASSNYKNIIITPLGKIEEQ